MFMQTRMAAAIAVALSALAAHPVRAQSPQPPATQQKPDTLEGQKLTPIVVTGNPLGSDLFDLVSPVTLLADEKLKYRLAPTLGETLSSEPGINSSYYGPNASRPVIRGLDGEHIRILQNGVGVIDASGTSVDHAVSLEPLLVNRIEVVRGPAALLYGTSGVGGVVNVIDNRIPMEAGDGSLHGGAALRYGSVNQEKSGAAFIEGGGENFALHADGFKRNTSDLKIPGFARSARLREASPLAPGKEEVSGKLVNSASTADGGAVGGSYVWSKGYFGASASQFNTDYGTVAEPTVTIKERQNRSDLAGEIRDPADWIKSAKLKFGYSDYMHTEFNGPDPGTTFKNKGFEGRVDVTHKKLGPLEGAFGFQTTQFDFSALGVEAFLPKTSTKIYSGFIYEEAPIGPVKLQGGLRFDRNKVSAEDDVNFGPGASRSFNTQGGSLGAVFSFDKVYALALSSSFTERAPNYQELFANGPHLATNAFEVGDRNLGIEKSTGLELSLRKRTGFVSGSVGVFYNRFRNFITLMPTGVIDPTFGVEIFNYVAVPATFKGAEAEVDFHLLDTKAQGVHLELRADHLRAENTDTGEPLPRISPTRFGTALVYETPRLISRFEVQRVGAQNRVSANELPTDGYTVVNASVNYRFKLDGVDLDAFLKGTNLTDKEARNHVSFLKDIAPLPGRGVTVGLNAHF